MKNTILIIVAAFILSSCTRKEFNIEVTCKCEVPPCKIEVYGMGMTYRNYNHEQTYYYVSRREFYRSMVTVYVQDKAGEKVSIIYKVNGVQYDIAGDYGNEHNELMILRDERY